jgi:hypothetical protein
LSGRTGQVAGSSIFLSASTLFFSALFAIRFLSFVRAESLARLKIFDIGFISVRPMAPDRDY